MTRRPGLLHASLAALTLWALVSAAVNGRGGSDAWPYAVAAASLALGVVLGLLAARVMVPLGLVTAAVFLVAEAKIGHPWAGPLGGLLGYANAEAALAVQLAALPLLAGARVHRVRLGWWALSALVVGVSVLSSSAAGMVLGTVLLVVGAWAMRERQPSAGWSALVGGVVVVALGVLQCILTRLAWPTAAVSALSSRRIDLWRDALAISGSSPTIGRGPGSFAELSPTASDPDTTAAHSVLMQVLAELGIVGAVLLSGVLVGGFWLLQSAQPRFRLIGVAAWSALWVHGLVDYVLHFPAVVLAGGLALGVAVGAREEPADLPVPAADGDSGGRKGRRPLAP